MKSLVAGKWKVEAKIRESAAPRGRVLIVDDEEVIASTLKEFLQGEQFEVATAMDLPSALAQVQAFEPEIVLCDVQLPGADGIHVLNRTLQVRPETLFIMITAYATVENAISVSEALRRTRVNCDIRSTGNSSTSATAAAMTPAEVMTEFTMASMAARCFCGVSSLTIIGITT